MDVDDVWTPAELATIAAVQVMSQCCPIVEATEVAKRLVFERKRLGGDPSRPVRELALRRVVYREGQTT